MNWYQMYSNSVNSSSSSFSGAEGQLQDRSFRNVACLIQSVVYGSFLIKLQLCTMVSFLQLCVILIMSCFLKIFILCHIIVMFFEKCSPLKKHRNT